MKYFSRSLIALSVSAVAHGVMAKSAIKNDLSFDVLRKIYIIELLDEPVATYKGGVSGLTKTSIEFSKQPQARLKNKHFGRFKSAASQNYYRYLQTKRDNFLNRAGVQLSRHLSPVFVYDTVMNGLAVSLTSIEAFRLKSMPGVKSVVPNEFSHPHTDRGPILINAPTIWSGSATGVAAKGEGMVVGVIDTGINHDHPSFAAVDPVDGYVHTNPLGNNVFLGACVDQPSLCNNKLIGSYNFAEDITSPEDTEGHGTHVTSTVAGNHISFDLGNGNSWNISGVAPRANIINYRISGDDGFASSAAIVAAIDQAVENGVDVINYSFGSSSPFSDPWTNTGAQAYQRARAAGVLVMTSAGNDGPGETTVGTPANAPWLTTVASSTHDRQNINDYPGKTMSNMTGGNTTPPSTLSGGSLTGEVTAPIVYAGNFNNGDTNPEQCLSPFPAGTFSGQIVVCDRGEIARVEKAINVAQGGAGGYVLANVEGGSTTINRDIYVVPGIHINVNDSNTLRTWLASGTGHTATINGTTGNIGTVAGAADRMSGFSSRGPTGFPPEIMKPSVAAPGSNIFAAELAPAEYGYNSGTSMASPHTAGAGVLLKQLKPNWTPGQIHSALITTGIRNLMKEDGTTSADSFDMGGGRIDLSTAVKAGLLMDETDANFTAANPNNTPTAGDPKTLNLPGMVNTQCISSCTWNREVEAAQSGSWNATFVNDNGLALSLNPSSFTLTAGQKQSLLISSVITNAKDEDWLFGQVILTPTNNAISTTTLPVAVKVSNSNLEESFEIKAQRNSGGHQIENVITVASANMTTLGLLTELQPTQGSVAQDSNNDEVFDDLSDGVEVSTLTVPADSRKLYVDLVGDASANLDLDLYVGFDANNDGLASENEILISSSTSSSNEMISISQPAAGTYWVLVHNFNGTGVTTPNDYTFNAGVLPLAPSSQITVTAPSSSDGTTGFNLAMNYQGITGVNARYFGEIMLSRGNDIADLGSIDFLLERESNDVALSVASNSVIAGSNQTVTVNVSPNSNETRAYTVTMEVPSGLTVDASTLSNGATLSGTTVSWSGNTTGSRVEFSFTATVDDSLSSQNMTLQAVHNVNSVGTEEETTDVTFAIVAKTNIDTPPDNSSDSSSGGGGSLSWLSLLLLGLFNRKK